LRLYEHEAKELFAEAGIPIPGSALITGPGEAERGGDEVGYPLVAKAQVLIGGRGKAGGILKIESKEQLKERLAELWGKKIRGYAVERILLEEMVPYQKEFYLGITIDRVNYRLALIASTEGGVEIERVAKDKPEALARLFLDIDSRFYPYMGVALLKKLGIGGRALNSFTSILSRMHRLFIEHEAKMVEINPLGSLEDGKVIALDARMNLDDDALFRHPELARFNLTDRHEEGERTPREMEALSAGIPYLDLDGDIGMFPGGAGFGIMGNDFITYYGGKPANFMDSGGGPTPERIARMLMLLNENPRVRAIFGARFGGVSRCDDFAKGLIIFLSEHELTKPMALRMTGNMWEEGLRLLTEAREKNPQFFANIELYGIETPIEEVCKRAVALARGDNVRS